MNHRTALPEQLETVAERGVPIDPKWVGLALDEIRTLRAELDEMCRLYELERRTLTELRAEISRLTASLRERF